MSAKQVLLITGGNTGLGYETVKALLKSEHVYDVILAARSLQKAEDAINGLQSEVPQTNSELHPLQLDITDDESIKDAFQDVSSKYNHLDCLVNNAGASFDSQIDHTDLSSIREQWNNNWNVNVAGTHVVTYAFVPLLLKSAVPKLVFITSGASSLTTTTSMDSPMASRLNAAPPAGWPKERPFPAAGYRSSKTGMNMMMREWEKALRNDNVRVQCISPGFLATNLGGAGPDVLKKMGAVPPSAGGEFVRDVIQGKRDHEAGFISEYFTESDVQPW